MSTGMTSKPRVIVVAHSVDPADGGMEYVHARLIHELLDEIDVTVVSCRLDPALEGRVDFHRVAVPLRPAPVRFVLFFVVASLMVWRLRRPGTVVHTCGAIIGNHVDLATIHTVGPAVVEARGGRLAPPGAPWSRRVNSGLLRWIAIRAEHWAYRPGRLRMLAAVSDLTASELARFFPGVPIVVTPNAVDTVRFHPDPEVRAEVRTELGLGDEVVTLFVGGDFERKGLGVAIESLVHAPQVTLVAAGPGDLERASALASSLGVADRVRLLGRRGDVERLGAMADLFLCASLYEAAALALLEGAASGLALVSTRVGNAPEIVGEGAQAAGILVERDPEAIGAALEELAVDPERRRRCSEAALDRVSSRSWDVVARQVLDLYRQLAED